MKVIMEEVEGAFYQDIILSEQEILWLKQGLIVEGTTMAKSKKYYVGVRLGEEWKYIPETYNHEAK